MPEIQSDGAGSTAPEDTLFGDSSSPEQTTPAVAAPTKTDVPADDLLLEPDDNVDPANSLDDPSPADALSKEGGDEGGEGKPTEFTDFEIPEGVSTFGDDVVAELRGVASELGLNQEQAQKIIDRLGPKQLAAQQHVVTTTLDGWAKQTRADKEVGGVNYKSSISNMRRAVAEYATPALKQLLVGENTKLVNHPEILRLLSRVGQSLGPDRSRVTGGPLTKPKVNVQDPMATPDDTADMLFG
jgi:hypothetical protein